MARQRITNRGPLSHSAAVRLAQRHTREQMGLRSITELDDAERRVVARYAAALERGRLSTKWNSPLAVWLAMVGRRPMFVEHDVGSGDYRRREKVMDWRVYEARQ